MEQKFHLTHCLIFLGYILRRISLKIYSKFTGEHPWGGVILIELLCNFIETTLRHRCFLRTPFPKNISGGLLPFYIFFILTMNV